jgi:zinc transporter ZupT
MRYILLILAVLLSFVFVALAKPRKTVGLRLLLAFSGAFLLALTVFDLLPEVYMASDPRAMGVFIMAGILIQIFLEFFSKGAEHGHMHWDEQKKSFPVLLFVSLCIHSFMEGLPLTNTNPILFGILVHKIPIALILSTFLLNSPMKKWVAFGFILVFSLMTPLGSLMANHIEFIITHKAPITAIVIGILLHISTVILFESSQGHTFNLRKLIAIFFGILVAYFI